MNDAVKVCETMQERVTARLSGELAPDELAGLEHHLESCPACAAEAALAAELWQALGAADASGEPVPSERMRGRLDAALAAEAAALAAHDRAGSTVVAFPGEHARRGARQGFTRRLLALAATLVVGLGLGYLFFGQRGDDVALLRREVGDLHEMVALSLLERGSVSERLQGVAYGKNYAGGGTAGAQDDRVVGALFARLLEDPDVNVRLAALEALRPVAGRDDRRGELVAAVARQKSPLVALSLIDLLLQSGSAAARHDLEQLLANDQLDPVVRGYLRDRLGRSA